VGFYNTWGVFMLCKNPLSEKPKDLNNLNHQQRQPRSKNKAIPNALQNTIRIKSIKRSPGATG
jgi:hypothetical protein